jgi:hypothetical protein
MALHIFAPTSVPWTSRLRRLVRLGMVIGGVIGLAIALAGPIWSTYEVASFMSGCSYPYDARVIPPVIFGAPLVPIACLVGADIGGLIGILAWWLERNLRPGRTIESPSPAGT